MQISIAVLVAIVALSASRTFAAEEEWWIFGTRAGCAPSELSLHRFMLTAEKAHWGPYSVETVNKAYFVNCKGGEKTKFVFFQNA